MSDYAEHPLPPAQREPRDVSYRMLALGAVGVLSILVMLGGACWWLFPSAMRDQADIRPLPAYPSPSLQPSPPADMRAFLHQQVQWLTSTGWIDRDRAIAHIPIDDAMRRVAAAGIPDWPTSATTELQR